MTAPPNPEGYPLAETWEDCARHVEAGGVVQEWLGDAWVPSRYDADYFWAASNSVEMRLLRRLVPIDWHTPEPGTYTYIDPPRPPSDLSVVIGLALLTTDRDPDEDAALARVIAVAGLGDLFPGTQGTPAVSSLTEGDDEDRCGWCAGLAVGLSCDCPTTHTLPPARYGVRP